MDLSYFKTLIQIPAYCETDPIYTACYWTFWLGALFWLLSRIDYSWVDRVWSILPIIYEGNFLYHQKYCKNESISARQIVMFILTILWGGRLTYNFIRKGGYFNKNRQDAEDYRWKYIRKNWNRIKVILLLITFVSFGQIYLILWFSSPIYFAKDTPFGWFDGLLVVVWFLLFLGEKLADDQQKAFQEEKRNQMDKFGQLQKCPLPYRDGFISDGLFRLSRHPNYFCEIMMWWVMFLFSVNSVGWNWSGLGALGLNLLFFGSIHLTEKITKQKYGRTYTRYQQNTSMLIPWLGRNNSKTI